MVEFAKRVPGFCDLSQDDQLILIKVGFFEVWLSHISKMTTDSSMTFEDGTYITRQQMELMYEVRTRLSFSMAVGCNQCLIIRCEKQHKYLKIETYCGRVSFIRTS